ncbi:unnamed protein product [Closterium sp. NIES-65]|nr:unnamed protein product [Closterium sp. NIES-65]
MAAMTQRRRSAVRSSFHFIIDLVPVAVILDGPLLATDGSAVGAVVGLAAGAGGGDAPCGGMGDAAGAGGGDAPCGGMGDAAGAGGGDAPCGGMGDAAGAGGGDADAGGWDLVAIEGADVVVPVAIPCRECVAAATQPGFGYNLLPKAKPRCGVADPPFIIIPFGMLRDIISITNLHEKGMGGEW